MFFCDLLQTFRADIKRPELTMKAINCYIDHFLLGSYFECNLIIRPSGMTFCWYLSNE